MGFGENPAQKTLKYLGMIVFLLLLCAHPHLIVSGGIHVFASGDPRVQGKVPEERMMLDSGRR